jgi:hypothetical protein
MNSALFKKLHRNFIRYLNSSKQARLNSSESNLRLRFKSPLFVNGATHKKFKDPRLKTRKLTEVATSISAKNRFGGLFPDWISLVEVNDKHTRVIKRYLNEIRIDQEVIAEINMNSYGMLHQYFKVYKNEEFTGDLGTFNLLSVISPNIFTIANKIVKDKGLPPLHKSFYSVSDISKNDMFNHEVYWPDRDRSEDRYSYIYEIRRRKLFGMEKKKSSRKFKYDHEADHKYYDWNLAFKSTQNPLTFKLTKAETVLLVVHELFKLGISPKLRFSVLRKRKCRLCARSFNPYIETSWYGLIPPNVCDICLTLALDGELYIQEVYDFTRNQIKNNCLAGVKFFESVFGFVPSSNLDRRGMLEDLLDIRKLSNSHKAFLFALATLPRRETVKKVFDSWVHLLAEAELLESNRTPQGGYRSIASDGHLCLSTGERLVCEFLTKSQIKHTKEPVYPRDKTLNPRGLLRADFKVADTLIEFAGRMSKADYLSNIERKRKLARKFKIKLIILETFDQDAIEELTHKFVIKRP